MDWLIPCEAEWVELVTATSDETNQIDPPLRHFERGQRTIGLPLTVEPVASRRCLLKEIAVDRVVSHPDDFLDGQP